MEWLLYSEGQWHGEMADLCSKTNSKDFDQPWKFLKRGSFREEVSIFFILHGIQIFFWLVGGEVTGWCSRNLVLSLELPPFIKGFILYTHTHTHIYYIHIYIIYMYIYIYIYIYIYTHIINTYISWGGARVLSLGSIIFSWLLLLSFCILSLPW